MVCRSRNTKRNYSKKRMTGGQETAGATPLPPQWFNPKQPFGFDKSNMKTAYGEANPVSAPCRNLAAFPKSSGIQTGGLKKKVKSKKTKKRSTSKKSVKKTKSKKSVKKLKSKKSVKKSKSKKTKRGGSKNTNKEIKKNTYKKK